MHRNRNNIPPQAKHCLLGVVLVVFCVLALHRLGVLPDLWAGPAPVTVPTARSSVLAALDLDALEPVHLPSAPAAGPLRIDLRDIFAPAVTPAPETIEPPAVAATVVRAPSAPTFDLKGTIVGRGLPLAIINDRFVGPGDAIDGYTVIDIGAHQVMLAAGEHTVTLRTVEYD